MSHSTAVVASENKSNGASKSGTSTAQPRGLPGQRRQTDGKIFPPRSWMSPVYKRVPATASSATLAQQPLRANQIDANWFVRDVRLGMLQRYDELLDKCIHESALPKSEELPKERQTLIRKAIRQTQKIKTLVDLKAFLEKTEPGNLQSLKILEKFRPMRALGQHLLKNLPASPETDEMHMLYVKRYELEMQEMLNEEWCKIDNQGQLLEYRETVKRSLDCKERLQSNVGPNAQLQWTPPDPQAPIRSMASQLSTAMEYAMKAHNSSVTSKEEKAAALELWLTKLDQAFATKRIKRQEPRLKSSELNADKLNKPPKHAHQVRSKPCAVADDKIILQEVAVSAQERAHWALMAKVDLD
jgi:hypothetical protein